MRKLLVCQHVPFEILGTLDPLFRRSGLRIRYVNFGRFPDAVPQLDGYHGLVVLGGPMSVDDRAAHPHLETEVELIRQAIHKEIPVLGVCLGAQLIAKALGARVRRSKEKEIGWYDVSPTRDARNDPLLRHFRPTEKIFQWHGDTFDMPKDTVHLAVSPTCENQAFRYRDNVYGLQFHLEVDEPMIERWLRVPIHRKEIESLNGKVDPDEIRRQTSRYIERLKKLSDQTYGEFVKLFGIHKTRRMHPSR